MRARLHPSVALLVLFAAIPSGRAQEETAPATPALDAKAAKALALEFLDDERGAASREKIRVLWPEGEPKLPEPGAEVVLIGGYVSNTLTVLRWDGEEVDGLHLDMARSWFYNPRGEGWTRRSVRMPAAEFLVRWGAALLIAGARTERIVPPAGMPEDGSGGYACGMSHRPEQWIRLRTPGMGPPLYLGNQAAGLFDYEGILDFTEARGQALFRLFDGPVRARLVRVDAPLDGTPGPRDALRPFLREEFARFLETPLAGPDGNALLLVEMALRALSVASDAADREIVERVTARLAKMDPDDHGVRRVREEAALARVRLRLTWAWEPAFAATTIREHPRERHAQEDLVKWVRRRYRSLDPEGYRRMLVDDLHGSADARGYLLETIGEVGRCYPAEARALLGPLEKGGDPEVAAAVRLALISKPAPR